MREVTAGVDIGGTNTKFGLVDRDGNVLIQGSISTQNHDTFEDFINDMARAIHEAVGKVGNCS